MMAGIDPTLRMHVFHGVETKEEEFFFFICETIWTVKKVEYNDANIESLAKKFKDHPLLWYMKYHTTTPVG
jgi:hypothetical protein